MATDQFAGALSGWGLAEEGAFVAHVVQGAARRGAAPLQRLESSSASS